MIDWLPGYERIELTACTGPGTYKGAPWKHVWHTTEGSSVDVALNIFRAAPQCSNPHFVVDPVGGRKIQLIPLSWSGSALRAGRNGWETNKANAIQTEVIGFAAGTHLWDDAKLKFLGEHLAAIIDAGIDLGDLSNSPKQLGQNDGWIAREDAPQRLSPQAFWNFRGDLGHQNVPFNDHWDPGALNLDKIHDYAKAAIGGSTTGDWFSMATEADLEKVLRRVLGTDADPYKGKTLVDVLGQFHIDTRKWSQYFVDGLGRRIARQLDPVGGMPEDAGKPVHRQLVESIYNYVKPKGA